MSLYYVHGVMGLQAAWHNTHYVNCKGVASRVERPELQADWFPKDSADSHYASSITAHL